MGPADRERENVGFARANNQGLALATGRYVLLLNPDTEVHAGALEALVAFMDAHPRAGACGARLLNADGSLQPACHPMLTPGREFWRLLFLERLWPRATYPLGRWDTVTPRRVEVIKGACLLLRRAALDQVGVLDDSYFMYTEEVDLCYRLAAGRLGVLVCPGGGRHPLRRGQLPPGARGDVRPALPLEDPVLPQVRRRAACPPGQNAPRAGLRPALARGRGRQPVLSPLARPARTFRRLLAELPGM